MAEETIGKGYIQILPSIKDFKPQLEKEIKTDLSSAGTDAGNSFSDSLKSALKTAGIVFAVKEVVEGVSAVVQQSISNYAEFESATAKVATIMDTSVMSIEEMQTGIMDLSNQFGISTSELSDTVYNAISATGDTANALTIAENAAKLASAGFTDSSSALSVLTTAMNAYGLSADEASAISDSLIQVQNLGVTTVAELSTVMGKAIASASAYGVDLGNVEAAYVAMTKAGINTAESTTYMSSMMKELGDSGSDVSKTLMEMTGKSFPEMMSEGASLADVLGVLYEAVDGDSTALMNLWGSAEAGKAANAIINQGLDEFNNNLVTITSSAGATQSAFETMDDTLESKIGKLSTAWTNLLTGMASGQDITGLTENLVNQFDSVAESILPLVGNIADALPQVFETIGERLPELLGTLLPSLIESCVSLLTSLISNLPTVIKPLISALPSVVDSILTGLIDCLPDLISGLGSMVGTLVAELPTILGSLITSIPDIITSLGTGIGAGLLNIFTEIFSSQEMKDAIGQVETMIENVTTANDSLQTSLDNLEASYTKSGVSTEAQATAVGNLWTKLQELIGAEDSTAANQLLIEQYVSELNELVPGLGLAYDGVTGSLNMTNEEMMRHIDLMILEAQTQAAENFYVSAIEAQTQATYNKKQATDALITTLETYGLTASDVTTVLQALEGDTNAYNELVAKSNVNIFEQAGAIENVGQAAGEYLEAIGNETEAAEMAAYAEGLLEEALQASAEAQAEAASSATSASEATADAASDIEEATEQLATEVTDNLDEVQTAFDEVDPSTAVETMEQAGTDMAGATDIEPDVSTNTAEAMNSIIDEVDAKIEAVGTAFDNIRIKAVEVLGTDSTFMWYMGIVGERIPKKISTGIENNITVLTNELDQIISGITNRTNQLQSNLYDAGNMAGMGLYNGLASWQSALYSLAWSIASSINSAARSALQIRSPSHIMQEVGQFTGEGIAVGIEDSEKEVMASMDGLTEGMIGAVNGVVAVANNSAASLLSEPINVKGMLTQSVNGAISAQLSQPDNSNVMEIMMNIYNAVTQLANMKMVVDTGEFVGALAPAFDQAMATMATMEARK